MTLNWKSLYVYVSSMLSLLFWGGGREQWLNGVSTWLWIKWSVFEPCWGYLILLYLPTQIRFPIGGEQVQNLLTP